MRGELYPIWDQRAPWWVTAILAVTYIVCFFALAWAIKLLVLG